MGNQTIRVTLDCLQEEQLAKTKMALHHAEQELIYISSVVDACIELHPSTFRQLMNDDQAHVSKYVWRVLCEGRVFGSKVVFVFS